MNRTDSVVCVPIVGTDHIHDDTKDKLRDQLQIQPLFRIKLDKVAVECHDQELETNDAMHDDRSGLKQGNDASVNQYCPLLYPLSKCPNPYPLWNKVKGSFNVTSIAIEMRLRRLFLSPDFISFMNNIGMMMASIQTNQTKKKAANQNDLKPNDENCEWIWVAKHDHS